jgi:hypothetical protein
MAGMREMLSFLILLTASLCTEAAGVDVIDYREPTINNLFQANTDQYTFFSEPYIDLAKANGANSAKERRDSVFKSSPEKKLLMTFL